MKTIGRAISLLLIVVLILTPTPPPLRFTAEPGTILAGDRARLCYEGARPRKAEITPEGIFMEPDPARPECVKVRPLQTTEFHIAGRDSQGTLFAQNVTVAVKPATHIVQFYASPGWVEAGESILLCYGVALATSVKLTTPRLEELPLSENRCISETPKRTGRYTLVAAGAGGRVVSESFLVKVNVKQKPEDRSRKTGAGSPSK